jgi:hypothetical protein
MFDRKISAIVAVKTHGLTPSYPFKHTSSPSPFSQGRRGVVGWKTIKYVMKRLRPLPLWGRGLGGEVDRMKGGGGMSTCIFNILN